MRSWLWGCVYMTGGLNSIQVETNPGWDLSCVYKSRVGIKREDFNKPFLYHLYIFWKKDPAKDTTSLFNLGWAVYMHFSAFLNPASRPGLRFQPGLSCKRAIAFMCVASWNSSCKHSLSCRFLNPSIRRRYRSLFLHCSADASSILRKKKYKKFVRALTSTYVQKQVLLNNRSLHVLL